MKAIILSVVIFLVLMALVGLTQSPVGKPLEWSKTQKKWVPKKDHTIRYEQRGRR